MYRIVVADKESPRDGRFVEIIGSYDPRAEDAKQIIVDTDKARAWLAKGATPSDTVQALLKRAGVSAEA
jgi:small subunit ribosomal protein S16